MALIALQYKNVKIYKDLFFPHKDLANTAARNSQELSAEIYDSALLNIEKSTRSNGWSLIKNRDANGEILREIEKGIHQYLQQWYKKNYRLEQRDPNLVEKVRIALIKLFNDHSLFIQRQQEANGYLALVKDALKDIPKEFYTGLVNYLKESNRGALSGSKLHGMMESFKRIIEQGRDNQYSTLYNPSPLLLERMNEMERGLKEQKNELQQQVEAYHNENCELKQKVDAQAEQLQAQAENTEAQLQAQADQLRAEAWTTQAELKAEFNAQFQAQEAQLQTQEAQLQTQEAQLQTQEAQIRILMEKFAQMEKKEEQKPGQSAKPTFF